MVPFILNLGTRWRSVVSFTDWLIYPLESTPLPIEWKAGWARESVWTLWRREKSVASTGFRTPDRPARSSIAIPTEISWLQHNSLKHEMYLTDG
jgi:hypothetical protein